MENCKIIIYKLYKQIQLSMQDKVKKKIFKKDDPCMKAINVRKLTFISPCSGWGYDASTWQRRYLRKVRPQKKKSSPPPPPPVWPENLEGW